MGKTMLRVCLIVGCSAGLLAFMACGGDDFTTEATSSGGSTSTDAGGGPVTGGMGGTVAQSSGGQGGMGGSPPPCFDVDMDGVTDCEGDCDDMDPSSFPGAPEICGDAADNDCDGTADQMAVCMGLGTWVSELTGDDLNNFGTQASPWKTIGQGIATAVQIGASGVYVAEGDYDQHIDMVNGVSVYGGHQCDSNSCGWALDPSAYIANINNVSRQGVYADVTVKWPTTLSGFTINGLDVSGVGTFMIPGTAAVTLQNATLLLDNNIVNAGNENSCSNWQECGSFGVRIVGPTNDPLNGAIIQNSEINAGKSEGATCGAVVQHRLASIVKVLNNVIRGGECSWTRAVTAEQAGFGTQYIGNQIYAADQNGGGTSFAMFVGGYVEIDSNHINTDPAETGVCTNMNQNFWCGGIELGGAIATVTNNVIFGMPSPKSVGVHVSDNETAIGLVNLNANTIDAGGAAAGGAVTTNISVAITCRTVVGVNGQIGDIRNNILLGGQGANRFGLYEQDNNNSGKTCVPIAYENNDIFFPTLANAVDNAHSQWLTGTGRNNLATAADVNTQSYASGNVDNDPSLDATWHLNAGSMNIDAGTTTGAPLFDFDGEQRPQGNGVDIGADEAG
jgi:hypothetical protein